MPTITQRRCPRCGGQDLDGLEVKHAGAFVAFWCAVCALPWWYSPATGTCSLFHPRAVIRVFAGVVAGGSDVDCTEALEQDQESRESTLATAEAARLTPQELAAIRDVCRDVLERVAPGLVGTDDVRVWAAETGLRLCDEVERLRLALAAVQGDDACPS